MSKRVRWFILVLAVCAGLSLSGTARADEALWQKHMRAGMQAYQRGQYAEAAKLFEAALKETEEFGPEDPRLALSLNELALLYQAQGKYAQAEPLYKRALAVAEQALGPNHPQVATSLNNLALLYHHQGKYAEAEPLYKRALAIREKVLGPEHPHVAACLENYSVLLRKMNRGKEAEELEARAQAIRAKQSQQPPSQ